jgi:predicted transcriptional regulator
VRLRKIVLNTMPGMYFGNSTMQDDNRKSQLFQLFTNISGKTKIVEPMKKIHGTLRDREAVEREIALVMREILEQGLFKTKLRPIQLAKLVSAYYAGKNDTEIARELGDEKLSKTVARARVRLKLFRDLDFRMPFDREKMENLLESGKTMKEISDELGVSPSTLREYRHVIEQRDDESIDPYLERIKDVMEDRDLSEQMTRSATNDGLGDSIDITEAELIDVT